MTNPDLPRRFADLPLSLEKNSFIENMQAGGNTQVGTSSPTNSHREMDLPI